MKTNPVFSLHNIAGTAYLLPHGQGIADHQRGIRLNETGVFLWKTLHHITNYEELLACFAKYCDATAKDLPQLRQDLTDYLDQLFALGILLEEAPFYHHRTNLTDGSTCFQIGPLHVRLIGPLKYIAAELLSFQTDDTASTDLTIVLKNTAFPLPEQRLLLIQNPELCVYETVDQYAMQFPQMPHISGSLIFKSGSDATIYFNKPESESFCTDLFQVIRFLFLYTAQKHGCFVLHSASILYRGSAWLFSGHSGMGKSTHTNMWKELYHVPILNGDLNLLAITGGLPMVYGLPWCGPSGIFHTDAYPLGGIILLNQSTHDICIDLPMCQKILLTAQRLISPAWNAGMLQCNLDFMTALAKQIQICLLKCTKNDTAARTIKHWIDQKLIPYHCEKNN